MNDPNEVTVSIKINLTRFGIYPLPKGIWYRPLAHKRVIKAQCDIEGKPTGTFLLTPSYKEGNLVEGYMIDLSFMEATEELAARRDRAQRLRMNAAIEFERRQRPSEFDGEDEPPPAA